MVETVVHSIKDCKKGSRSTPPYLLTSMFTCKREYVWTARLGAQQGTQTRR